MHTLYTWFYCLPIPNTLFLLLVLSAGYLCLRRPLAKKRFGRLAISLLLLAWLAVIVSATLSGRSGISFRPEPELLPFHSYRAVMAGENPELLRSNFMNALLFYPAGLLGCDLLPGSWSRNRRVLAVTGLYVLLSLGIEYSQYLFALGQAEADDVIHNGLGAFLGGAVCEILPKKTSSHKTERSNAP